LDAVRGSQGSNIGATSKNAHAAASPRALQMAQPDFDANEGRVRFTEAELERLRELRATLALLEVQKATAQAALDSGG